MEAKFDPKAKVKQGQLSDTPEGNEFEAADLNSDGILNVQDVVILIGLILG